ncbi:MAG: cytochrome c3 family protein [Thermodesulfobacteriota bacterium]
MQHSRGHRWARLLLALLAALGAWLVSPAAAQTPAAQQSSWFVDLARFQAGAHGKLACAECHPAQEKALSPGQTQLKHPDPADPKYLTNPALRAYDYGQCQRCHRLAWQRYNQGAHAKALKDKVLTKQSRLPAPVCADCHDVHYARARRGRVALGRAQTNTCGACHPAQAATYLKDYHGQAGDKLGWDKAAFCSDCHQAHDCQSLKKPEAAQAACQRCHPQATPRFAQYIVHPASVDLGPADAAKAQRVYLLWALTAVLAVVAVCVVGFFYGHTLLWMLREIQHKLRKH